MLRLSSKCISISHALCLTYFCVEVRSNVMVLVVGTRELKLMKLLCMLILYNIYFVAK